MRRALLLGIFLLLYGHGFGQNDSLVQYDTSRISPLEITEDDLKPYWEDESFNYEVVKQENGWWTSIKNWLYNVLRRFFEWIFGVEEATGYVEGFFRLVPYLLLGILLFLIIRFFIKTKTRSLIFSQQNPNMVSLSEEERIIKTEDIQQLINKALAEKNYRLAIRYYYLHILKLLSERNLIEWKRQKTNDDYIDELSGSVLKNSFTRATLLYDYIWYGEFNIDQERYRSAEDVFTSLKKAIATDV